MGLCPPIYSLNGGPQNLSDSIINSVGIHFTTNLFSHKLSFHCCYLLPRSFKFPNSIVLNNKPLSSSKVLLAKDQTNDYWLQKSLFWGSNIHTKWEWFSLLPFSVVLHFIFFKGRSISKRTWVNIYKPICSPNLKEAESLRPIYHPLSIAILPVSLCSYKSFQLIVFLLFLSSKKGKVEL